MSDDKIMRLYKHPKHKGHAINAPIVLSAHGENPFCGDMVDFKIGLEEINGTMVVADAVWEGYGCSYCLAASDYLAGCLSHVSTAEALSFDEKTVLDGLGIVEIGRTRKDCVSLPIRVIKEVIASVLNNFASN